MSNVINQNLDEIISIKNQLSNVLIENGVEAGNRFSDYPDMFRSVIASGGSFNPSYYYTADEIDENFVSYSYATANYVSYSYLSEALEDIDVDVDLDDYVTYSYAYNTFVSYAYLGDLEQISEYILGSRSSSAPENVYATKTELGAYVSKIELSSLGYVTSSDIPVIDESLIPNTTATYILGDASHLYAATYSYQLNVGNNSKVYNDSGGITFSVNGNNGLRIGSNSLYPKTNKGYNIGSSSNIISTIYTSVLYADTAYLQDTSYSSSIIPKSTDTYTLGDSSNYYHTLYSNRLQGNSSVNIRTGGNNRLTITGTAMRPMNQNYNLGSSDYPFATAYISNIYNFIWTGTSAEYAALSDYTTYQIYLIQEA